MTMTTNETTAWIKIQKQTAMGTVCWTVPVDLAMVDDGDRAEHMAHWCRDTHLAMEWACNERPSAARPKVTKTAPPEAQKDVLVALKKGLALAEAPPEARKEVVEDLKKEAAPAEAPPATPAKPKRKRRTRAEMEADRGAEAKAKAESVPAPIVPPKRTVIKKPVVKKEAPITPVTPSVDESPQVARVRVDAWLEKSSETKFAKILENEGTLHQISDEAYEEMFVEKIVEMASGPIDELYKMTEKQWEAWKTEADKTWEKELTDSVPL